MNKLVYKSPITEIVKLDPKTRLMDSVLTSQNSNGAKDTQKPFGAPKRVF